MLRKLLRPVLLCGLFAACAAQPAVPLAVGLVPASAGAPARVQVTGLTPAELAGLTAAQLGADDWQRLLTVSISGGAAGEPPVNGEYAVTAAAVEFTPKFPFDPGRPYAVHFNPARLPQPRDAHAVDQILSLPAIAQEPTTVVSRATPTTPVVPENLLRMYLEFSAPMSPADGLEFVRLLDDRGLVVAGAFQPSGPEAWNPGRTRFTLHFVPGHRRPDPASPGPLGAVLKSGRRYTLDVDGRWPDANGRPLAMAYRQAFRVGAPDVRAIDPREWRFTPPASGRSDPAIVTFPEPLDQGLLLRALGVARDDGTPIAGTIRIDPGETRWNFIPDDPWRPGRYNLLVLSTLEDLAGNRIGELFDSRWLTGRDAVPPVTQTKMPFDVK